MEMHKTSDVSIDEATKNLEDTRQILSKTINGLLLRGEKLNVLSEKLNSLTEKSKQMNQKSSCTVSYCCII